MKNNKISILIITILCGILILFGLKYKNDMQEYRILSHNYETTIDSLHISEENALYWRKSYLDKENELNITKKEKKTIEKQLNESLAYISEINSQIKVDSVKIPIIIAPDSLNYEFHYKKPYLIFDARTDFSKNELNVDNISIPMNLTVGLTDNYTIFCKSDNPYVKINNIQGSTIDIQQKPVKQKRFGLSISAGLGMYYGISHKGLDLGPGILVGFSYRLF